MTQVALLTSAWRPVSPAGQQLPLTQWASLTVTRRVAGGDDAQIKLQQLHLDEQTGVLEGVRDLHVLLDGELWFRGRIADAPEELTDSGWTATVRAVCYGTWLDRRVVDAETLGFAQIDQADIGWALVDHVQAVTGGSLGITKGAVTVGTPRDRTYERGKNLREALDQLAAVQGGGDWWITPQRAYRWASPQRGTATGRVLDVRALGATDLKVEDSGRARCTAVWVSGGEGTTPVQAFAAGGPDWPEGRIDLVQSYSDVTEQATLQGKAAMAVAERGSETWTWTMPWESTQGTDVGDTATLVARLLPGGQTTQRLARLVERTLRADADGRVDAQDRWLATVPAGTVRWSHA